MQNNTCEQKLINDLWRDLSIQSGFCPDLVNARTLASHLDITDKSLLRMARKGRIPSVRFSKRVIRFDVSAVDRALKGRFAS